MKVSENYLAKVDKFIFNGGSIRSPHDDIRSLLNKEYVRK